MKFFFLQISEILLAKARYEGGLGRLDTTQQEVHEMQEMLKRLQPLLVTAAQDVQKILASVEKESSEVAEIEKVVKVDEEAAMVKKIFLEFNNVALLFLFSRFFKINSIRLDS